MELFFSFDKDEKNLIQTLACQPACNSCSCLTRTRELRKLWYKLLLLNSHRPVWVLLYLVQLWPLLLALDHVLPPKSFSCCVLGRTKRLGRTVQFSSRSCQETLVTRLDHVSIMAECEGASASVENEQTSEKMSLKAVVIGGTHAVGRYLLGDLLISKVVIIFMHLKYRDKEFWNSWVH